MHLVCFAGNTFVRAARYSQRLIDTYRQRREQIVTIAAASLTPSRVVIVVWNNRTYAYVLFPATNCSDLS